VEESRCWARGAMGDFTPGLPTTCMHERTEDLDGTSSRYVHSIRALWTRLDRPRGRAQVYICIPIIACTCRYTYSPARSRARNSMPPLPSGTDHPVSSVRLETPWPLPCRAGRGIPQLCACTWLQNHPSALRILASRIHVEA
jgi:hypothetical protein